MPENSSCIAFNLRDRIKIMSQCATLWNPAPFNLLWRFGHPLGLQENANVSDPSHIEQQCNTFAWVLFWKTRCQSFQHVSARFKWSNVLEKLSLSQDQWISESFSGYESILTSWGLQGSFRIEEIEYYRNWCWFSFNKNCLYGWNL